MKRFLFDNKVFGRVKERALKLFTCKYLINSLIAKFLFFPLFQNISLQSELKRIFKYLKVLLICQSVVYFYVYTTCTETSENHFLLV